MIVPRSHPIHPHLTPLTLYGILLKESSDIVIFGVTFDAKMTFEKNLHSVSRAKASWGMASWGMASWEKPAVFHDRPLLLRSFWSFILPVLEYYSAVWCSAADSYLKLQDRVIRSTVLSLAVFWSANLPIDDMKQCCECYIRLWITQCILWAVYCLWSMCRRVLLVVLWLLIGSRLRLLAAGLISTTEPACAPISVSLERSYWWCVWWCGTDGV